MKSIIIFFAIITLNCYGIGQVSGDKTRVLEGSVIERALNNGDLAGTANDPLNACDGCEERAAATLHQANFNNNRCSTNRFQNQSVLYIGDSHSYLRSQNGDRMGNQVYTRLNECGASNVQYHAACGSRARSWMPGSTPKTPCGLTTITNNGFRTANSGSTRNIEQLQRDQNPNVVIINLGDNMFGWSGGRSSINQSSVAREVAALVAAIDRNRSCIWIGPTYHSPGSSYTKPNAHVDQMYQAISQGLNGRCDLIDSRDVFSRTRPNDGLHLTGPESTVWGNSLADKLSELR